MKSLSLWGVMATLLLCSCWLPLPEEEAATQTQTSVQADTIQKESPPKVKAPSEPPPPPTFDGIVDITTIANKPLSEVEQILGKTTKSEKSRYGDKRYFKSNGLGYEITFINGVSDWITIGNISRDFGKENLVQLGLEKERPDFFNKNGTLRWENVQGFKLINVHGDFNGKVDYITVRTNTTLD